MKYAISCPRVRFATASRPGEKTTASHHQTREACPDNRAGYGNSGIHRSSVASLTAEYVGNEHVSKIILAGHISNRRIGNAEDEVAGDPKIPVPAGGAGNPETEIPCAVPVEGPGLCSQRLSYKRLSDANVPQRNASSVKFE